VTAGPNCPNTYRLAFACGPYEHHLIERTARLLEEILGIRPRITKRRTATAVERDSSSAARLFDALCGHGAKNKRVPAQMAHAPEPVIRAFLDGYFVGDGSITATHVVAGTVSRTLALGLYELGLHLGVLPTFFV